MLRARTHVRLPPLLAAAVCTVGLGTALPARAESIIKHPGDHPKYSFEAEPHLSIDLFGNRLGLGPGFRGTVVLVDNGFISSINNSVGLGFGLDWMFYGDHCGGPIGGRHCDATSDVIVPVVLQWNFWLSPHWSVFGEPGVAFHFLGGGRDHLWFDWFTIYGGGRYLFSDSVALTLRIGAPLLHDNVISVGASFLF